MRKTLGSVFTILTETVVIILFLLWYKRKNDYEPLIGLITTVSALIGSILLRLFKEDEHKPRLELELAWDTHGYRGLELSQNNSRDEQGQIVVSHSDAIWIREFRWEYILFIRNNSSFTAYEPKLLPIDNTLKLQTLSNREPIPAGGKVGLKGILQYTKETNQDEAKELNKYRYPPLLTNYKILVCYKNEEDKAKYTLFSFSEGKQYNQPKGFPYSVS